MRNIVHICYSESAQGSLKYALNKKYIIGDKVIGFSDDLSQGPIQNLNLQKRIDWWKKIIAKDDFYDECIKDFEMSYRNFNEQISKINELDEVYIWYGDSSIDICGMMCTLEWLKGKNIKLYGINVSEIIEELENGVYIYRTPAEIMPENLSEFLEVKKVISNEIVNNLVNQWNILKGENSNLRVLIENKIESVDVNYFDIDILKFTNKEFKKSARTVGEVLGNSNILVSDAYIFWRVKELIHLGMIEFKGDFGVMRQMEIKLSDKGLQYLKTDLRALKIWEDRIGEDKKYNQWVDCLKNEGRLEERIRIAKNLSDVLDVKVIAEKTGLSLEQVKNLRK